MDADELYSTAQVISKRYVALPLIHPHVRTTISIIHCSRVSLTSHHPPDILLAGDSSHSQDLYLPVPSPIYPKDPRSPNPVIDGKPELAINPAQATWTIGQLTRMSMEENVMVILAHEGEVEGVVDVYPGDVREWMEKGWKGAKEKEVGERAKRRAGIA
jgi:hypothetical protein